MDQILCFCSKCQAVPVLLPIRNREVYTLYFSAAEDF